MHDALFVRVMERVAQLRDDVELGVERQRQRRHDARGQARAAQELHHDVRRVAFFRELEHRDDVAMLELGGGAGLDVETRAQLLLVLGEVDQHQLDRHLAIEHRIHAAEEHTHPAFADALDDLIPSDLGRVVPRVHESLTECRRRSR